MFEGTVKSLSCEARRSVSAIQRHAALFGFIVLGAAVNCAIAKTGQNTWLEFVTLVPLFWPIRSGNVQLAGACGGLWGGTIAICTALGLGPPMALTAMAAFALITAPAVYSALGALLTRWIGFSPFVLAVGWLGVEFAFALFGTWTRLFETTIGHGCWGQHIQMALGYVIANGTVAYLNAAFAFASGKLVRAPALRVYFRSRRGEGDSRLKWLDNSALRKACSVCIAEPRAPPPPTTPREIMSRKLSG